MCTLMLSPREPTSCHANRKMDGAALYPLQQSPRKECGKRGRGGSLLSSMFSHLPGNLTSHIITTRGDACHARTEEADQRPATPTRLTDIGSAGCGNSSGDIEKREEIEGDNRRRGLYHPDALPFDEPPSLGARRTARSPPLVVANAGVRGRRPPRKMHQLVMDGVLWARYFLVIQQQPPEEGDSG
jgi:hypothetical protein